ncbi:unnamed protein product [Nezara viridula]|uniref:Phosphoserine phosphatase n=2 Tax=Nezara viridula TaxID=85310 RepID=A0A9P0HN18_NEZVI|nr:unnamed protein product [Nezara viridula]
MGLDTRRFNASRTYKMASTVKAIWKKADAVCFDVDSTVIREEAIDKLAEFCGKGKEIQSMTSAAMSGKMSFRESLSTRLNLIQPSMQQVQEFIRSKPPTLSVNIKKLINCLQRRGVPIYLVSGGFRGIIGPIALELNIPLENIFANKLKFFLSGEFAGFDENELTSRDGGKAEVIKHLIQKFGYSNIVMIGDGNTDLEASPPAHAFIGYGGNVVREAVKNKSQWYVTDFQELIDELS